MPVHHSHFEWQPQPQLHDILRSRFQQADGFIRLLTCIIPCLLLVVVPFIANGEILVAHDAEWKYFKGRSGPPPVQNGIDWTATDYDDSHGWGRPERGGFGYGEKYERGVLEDMKNQYATLYTRHRFTVDDPSEIRHLTLAVDYDDGFAAYINGREVARRNLPDDIIGHDTTALQSHEASRGRGAANPQEKEYIRIDPMALKAGTNLIAISGHNVHLSSRDFYLEAELSANPNLVRGPYIQMPTKDGVTIVWDTDAETVGTVDFGLDRNVSEGRVSETDAGRHHAITLDDLLPSRTYFYRLSNGDTPHAETYSLRAPSAPDQAYRFAVIGDFGYPDHQSTVTVANQVNKHEPDYLLTVGDNIYQHGQPGHYDPAWFTPYGVTMARGPTFPALGNHDIESENGRWFLEYFHLPENGPAGHEERNYSFDYGNAHVAVVDSNPFDRHEEAAMESIASWLEDDLNRTDKPWKLVTLHHALHASPGSRGIEPRLRDLAPIFESTGVQIVFQGHNHWYERSNPVNGVHYITTGAGGLSRHKAGKPNRYSAKLKDDLFSFVLVDVDGDRLSLQAIGEDGEAFDKLHLDLGHPFKMDGLLDEPSWKRASNGLDLYAAIRDNILYVAVQDAGEGSDHFIFVVEDTGSLQSAAWAKSGQSMAWSAFLADEDENGFHGWFDKAGNRLETPTHAYRSTTPGKSDTIRGRAVLEGTIDLMSHFDNRIPDRLFIAAAPYKSPEGGRLVAGSQVPAGDDDGDLEAQEFLSIDTRDLSVADPR